MTQEDFHRAGATIFEFIRDNLRTVIAVIFILGIAYERFGVVISHIDEQRQEVVALRVDLQQARVEFARLAEVDRGFEGRLAGVERRLDALLVAGLRTATTQTAQR